MTTEPLTVAVVSPQPIVLHGLEDLLSRHPDRVRVVVPPGRSEDTDPDVVLYDVLALLDGDTGPLEHLIEMTTAKILAVGRDLRPDLAGQALGKGAVGFVSIGASEVELLEAVEASCRSCPNGDGEDQQASVADPLGADVGLTEREVDVVSLIVLGLTNQEIAERLWLSVNSIKTYIRTAYRKIGAKSRTQAVSWAVQHGFRLHDPDVDQQPGETS